MSVAVESPVEFSSAIEPQSERPGLQERLSRPQTERHDSDFTVVDPATSSGEKLESMTDEAQIANGAAEQVQGVVYAVNVEVAYPPPIVSCALPITPVVELLSESRSLRRFRMFASFVTLFLAGWNGGATGALIPSIERAFGIGYARIAILFVSTFMGYAAAAAGGGVLSRKIGFGSALLAAVAIELIGNVINASQQASFGLMCFGFWIIGIAFATQLGLCNTYFTLLKKPLLYTGFLHGMFGLGAFASPLVATAMVTRGIPVQLFLVSFVRMLRHRYPS